MPTGSAKGPTPKGLPSVHPVTLVTVIQLSPRAKASTDRPNPRPAAGSNRPVRQTGRPAVHAGVIEVASGTGPSMKPSSIAPAPLPTRKVPGADPGSVE